MLRKEYGIDPDALHDDDWARLIQEQIYLRKIEDERFKDNLREVLYELAVKIYGNE